MRACSRLLHLSRKLKVSGVLVLFFSLSLFLRTLYLVSSMTSNAREDGPICKYILKLSLLAYSSSLIPIYDSSIYLTFAHAISRSLSSTSCCWLTPRYMLSRKREKTADLVTRCFEIEMNSRDRHRQPISKVEYPDETQGQVAIGLRPGKFLWPWTWHWMYNCEVAFIFERRSHSKDTRIINFANNRKFQFLKQRTE